MSDIDNTLLVNIRVIEKILLKLTACRLHTNDSECIVQLNVQDIGKWIIKFRRNGILVNNMHITFNDMNTPTATVTFSSTSLFSNIVNGSIKWEAAVKNKHLHVAGNDKDVAIFKVHMGIFDASTAATTVATATTIGNSSSSNTSRSNGINTNKNSIATTLSSSVKSMAAVEVESKCFPIKFGWLLKKGAIISGWRCRYFVVYPGKVEYFMDEHDITPKGVIELSGAQIYPAKRCNVNGVSDHWGWIVEPHARYREKSFRLASELMGDDGQIDAYTWVQVFEIATSTHKYNKMNSNGTNHYLYGNNAVDRLDNHHLTTEIGAAFDDSISTVEPKRKSDKTTTLSVYVCISFAIALMLAYYLYSAYTSVHQYMLK